MPPHASVAFFDGNTACYREQEDICWSRVSKQRSAESAPKLTRSVTFKNVVRAKKILHIDDYTEDDIKKCWYAHYDFANMRCIARIDAQMLEKGNRLNPNQCTEGLRIYTASGRKTRRRNVRRGISIVLEEQMLQIEEGSHDPEFIAQLYAEATASARNEALLPFPNRRNKRPFLKRVSLGL